MVTDSAYVLKTGVKGQKNEVPFFSLRFILINLENLSLLIYFSNRFLLIDNMFGTVETLSDIEHYQKSTLIYAFA